MKTIRWTILAVAMVALLLSVGTLPATAVSPTDTGPAGATFIDSQLHTIAPNTAVWYRFNYQGDESLVTISMPGDAKYEVRFEIYSPAQMALWWKEDPFGQGTDKGDDHFWAGSTMESGTYYVRVINSEPTAMSYTLVINGKGVSVGSKIQPPVAVQPVLHPAVNTVPEQALSLKSQLDTISANATLWYRFTYARDDSNITLRLLNGNAMGLKFSIYASDQIAKWWDVDPTGRGNVDGDDLIWSGGANAGTVYFVKVVNENNYDLNFQFTMHGARGPF